MIRAFRSFFFIILGLLPWGKPLLATHIVGGDLTYRHLGGDNYILTLYLYIDCKNGDPGAIDQDRFSQVGVFASNGMLMQSVPLTRTGPTRIEAKNYSCVVPPADQCVDLYIFTGNAFIPDRAGGYNLLFQRCCRNYSIKNIINPEATGATYRTHIPQRNIVTNSSAKFSATPPNFLCTNEPLVFDHSAVDPDGDSLVYELFQPLHGASQNDPAPHPSNFTAATGVNWRNPYNTWNQLPSMPTMSIDPQTGLLKITPTDVGQFVAGIAVHEYRNGVKINTVFRDFQFNIYNCVFTIRSAFTTVPGPCSDTVRFQNSSSGSPVRYKWDFGLDNRSDDTSNLTNPTFVFPGPGYYTIKLWAFNNVGCSTLFTRDIHILPPGIPGIISDSLACRGDQVQLAYISNEPNIWYNWSPPTDLNNPNIANPIATLSGSRDYVLRKSSISCYIEQGLRVEMDSIKADFIHEYLPPCDGLRVKYFSKSINHTQLRWDFGDPKTLADFSFDSETSWFYTDSGLVYVKLTVNNDRCRDSIIKPLKIYFPETFTAVIDTALCWGESVRIGPLNDTSILEFEWSTNEFLNSDQILYPISTPTRSISYVLHKTYAHCKLKDSFNVVVNQLPDFKITRSVPEKICPQDSIFLSTSGDYQFEWFPKQGLRNPFAGQTWAQPDSSRWYILQAQTAANCLAYDSVFIELFPTYELNLDPFYVACVGQAFLPPTGVPEGEFSWKPLGREFLIDSAREEGNYYLSIRTNCQFLEDTFRLTHYQDDYCLIDLPNAFSPNGDGINDTYPYGGRFYDIFGEECNFEDFQIIIFNRWGEIVYRSQDPSENWDGSFKENDGTIDVLGYYLTFKEFDWCTGHYITRSKKGNITLMR